MLILVSCANFEDAFKDDYYYSNKSFTICDALDKQLSEKEYIVVDTLFSINYHVMHTIVSDENNDIKYPPYFVNKNARIMQKNIMLLEDYI